MDAFITRKRKSDPPEDQEVTGNEIDDIADDEPTDVKLAMLASMHPNFSQEALLDILLAHNGCVSAASASLFAPNTSGSSLPTKKASASTVLSQTSLRNFTRSNQDEMPSQKKTKLLSKKGTTLHLYDPDDVAEHTPCSIIHNFLPTDLANELLREMLKESKTFEKITFKLFDNVVSSPHTSSFYVDSFEEMQKQKFEVGRASRPW